MPRRPTRNNFKRRRIIIDGGHGPRRRTTTPPWLVLKHGVLSNQKCTMNILEFLDRKSIQQLVHVPPIKQRFRRHTTYIGNDYCLVHGTKKKAQRNRDGNHWYYSFNNNYKECEDCVQERKGSKRCDQCEEFEHDDDVYHCDFCKQNVCELCLEEGADDNNDGGNDNNNNNNNNNSASGDDGANNRWGRCKGCKKRTCGLVNCPKLLSCESCADRWDGGSNNDDEEYCTECAEKNFTTCPTCTSNPRKYCTECAQQHFFSCPTCECISCPECCEQQQVPFCGNCNMPVCCGCTIKCDSCNQVFCSDCHNNNLLQYCVGCEEYFCCQPIYSCQEDGCWRSYCGNNDSDWCSQAIQTCHGCDKTLCCEHIFGSVCESETCGSPFCLECSDSFLFHCYHCKRDHCKKYKPHSSCKKCYKTVCASCSFHPLKLQQETTTTTAAAEPRARVTTTTSSAEEEGEALAAAAPSLANSNSNNISATTTTSNFFFNNPHNHHRQLVELEEVVEDTTTCRNCQAPLCGSCKQYQDCPNCKTKLCFDCSVGCSKCGVAICTRYCFETYHECGECEKQICKDCKDLSPNYSCPCRGNQQHPQVVVGTTTTIPDDGECGKHHDDDQYFTCTLCQRQCHGSYDRVPSACCEKKNTDVCLDCHELVACPECSGLGRPICGECQRVSCFHPCNKIMSLPSLGSSTTTGQEEGGKSI